MNHDWLYVPMYGERPVKLCGACGASFAQSKLTCVGGHLDGKQLAVRAYRIRGITPPSLKLELVK